MRKKIAQKLLGVTLTFVTIFQLGVPVAFADDVKVSDLDVLNVGSVDIESTLTPLDKKAIEKFEEHYQNYLENEAIASENSFYKQLSDTYGLIPESLYQYKGIAERFNGVTRIHENSEYLLENLHPDRNKNKPSLYRTINEAEGKSMLEVSEVVELKEKMDKLVEHVYNDSNFSTGGTLVSFISGYRDLLFLMDPSRPEEALGTQMTKSIENLQKKVPQYLNLEIVGELVKTSYYEGESLDFNGVKFLQQVGIEGNEASIQRKSIAPENIIFRAGGLDVGEIISSDDPLRISGSGISKETHKILAYSIKKNALLLPFDKEVGATVKIQKEKSIGTVTVKKLREIQFNEDSIKAEYRAGERFEPTFTLIAEDGSREIANQSMVTITGGVQSGTILSNAHNATSVTLTASLGDKRTAVTRTIKVIENEALAKKNQARLQIGAIENKKYGDAPFALSVQGGSGTGRISYEVPNNNGVLTIADGLVTIIGSGKTTITVRKSGDNEYNETMTTLEVEIKNPTKPTPITTPTQQFIKRFYNVILARAEDPTGLAEWNGLLSTKQSGAAEIAYGFIFSPEYTGKNKSDADYVTDLYSAFFNRPPDAEGFAGWKKELVSGKSRLEVFNGFIYSREFRQLCEEYGVEASGITIFVSRFYNICLNRNPDAQGRDSWVDRLRNHQDTGYDTSYGVLFSQEYIEKNRTNSQFVMDLYRTFLDREPDNIGYNAWLEQLNNGKSRLNVFEGFVSSTEFAKLCLKYGILAR